MTATYNAARYEAEWIRRLLCTVGSVALMCATDPRQDARRCIDAATRADVREPRSASSLA
jgi:hypothetical protein